MAGLAWEVLAARTYGREARGLVEPGNLLDTRILLPSCPHFGATHRVISATGRASLLRVPVRCGWVATYTAPGCPSAE